MVCTNHHATLHYSGVRLERSDIIDGGVYVYKYENGSFTYTNRINSNASTKLGTTTKVHNDLIVTGGIKSGNGYIHSIKGVLF